MKIKNKEKFFQENHVEDQKVGRPNILHQLPLNGIKILLIEETLGRDLFCLVCVGHITLVFENNEKWIH